MNIKFYDKKLLRDLLSFILTIEALFGFAALFYGEWIKDNRNFIMAGCFVIFLVYYLIKLYLINKIKKITLDIMSSTFIVKEGDIFEHKKGELNVINFNEYFDTCVDNKIIAEKSLNGKYLKKYVLDLSELDKKIDNTLNPVEIVSERKSGKKKKYELGSIVEHEGFLLTSLTKFSEDNRAYIELKDYLSFLMNFWNNLDKIYADRSVVITLFGSSSLTRMTDVYDITEQQLLEIIIWTFKISKIKFKYPTTITLVLTKDLLKKINLNKIKEMYKYDI